jgi:hypothetical protein
MDITFKTNRFQIKLFNIVGITFLNITFYLAFMFLTHKATPDFAWVFTRLKWVYDQLELPHPRTLVTDQKPGLLPALKKCSLRPRNSSVRGISITTWRCTYARPLQSTMICWSTSSPWHVTWPIYGLAAPINTICVQLLHHDRDRETPNDEVAHVVKTILAAFMAHWKTLMYALSEQAFDEA